MSADCQTKYSWLSDAELVIAVKNMDKLSALEFSLAIRLEAQLLRNVFTGENPDQQQLNFN